MDETEIITFRNAEVSEVSAISIQANIEELTVEVFFEYIADFRLRASIHKECLSIANPSNGRSPFRLVRYHIEENGRERQVIVHHGSSHSF